MFKNSSLFLIYMLFFSISSFSQELWTKIKHNEILSQKKELLTSKISPKNFTLMSLDIEAFKSALLTTQSKNISSIKIIKLPDASGELQRFSIEETSYLAPELAAKFPLIKSYTAKGIDVPTATAKITVGKNGVHAAIYAINQSTLYIDPYTTDYKEYIVFKRNDVDSLTNEFECLVEDSFKSNSPNLQRRNADDGNLRTYRMALVCTGEYAQFHLNRQGVPVTATDAEKKEVVLSAINTTITRVNQIFERDLAVRMVLVGNNDELIFLDESTDELTNEEAYSLIEESQEKCDAIIGDANYDIGHAFSTGAGGLAQLSSVCETGYKAQGVTGRSTPVGDTFDVDYVAHEIGHQFGATHTFNNSCSGNRSAETAVEPGSGSTIMSYAGICTPDIQNFVDDYFHAVSIDQMWAHVRGTGSCAVLSSTGNNAPTANAGANVSIPKSTPFVLKGTATDVDGTATLSYTWEQIDNEIAAMSPVSTNTGGPMFRSLAPSNSLNRYMPALTTVLNGNTATTWEVLPSVARELDFAFVVRDNHANGGSSARDDIKVTVVDAEPFTITSPNSSVSWGTGSRQTITWSKGTSDQAPINCANVNIKLSTDGGLTFPIILKSNTPNDGAEEIVIPDTPTTSARILVEAADNIFYNINNEDFVIFQANPTYSISNITGDMSVCKIATNELAFDFNYRALYGFNETVTLSTSGAPQNSTATLSTTTMDASGEFTLTLGNLSAVDNGDYTITVTASSSSTTKSVNFLLNVNEGLCNSSGSTESQVSIINLTFNSINNNSDKTSGYSDFTSLETQLVRGESYELSTTINAAGNSEVSTFAWIDWNQNCVFDTDETYEITSNTLMITVPEDAILGSATMRVSVRPDENPNACGLNFDGEVEDYTVTVEELYATNETLFDDLEIGPVPVDSGQAFNTFKFTVKDKNSIIIRLFDFRGRLLENKEFSTISSMFNKEVRFNKTASGVYLMQIENAGKQLIRKIVIR